MSGSRYGRLYKERSKRMRAVHLRTEYLKNPIGIDIRKPRFFWQCEGGKKQSAYRITARRKTFGNVSAEKKTAEMEEDIVWDTGKVSSASMTHIRYEGKTLHSRDLVIWSVQLWDEEDRQGEVSEACFEMGLLDPADWKAKWITGDYKPKKKERYPVDYFRKDFRLTQNRENVVSARLYATAHGVYDAEINGRYIEDFVLAPGVTDYRKRLQYQVYDITADIKQGCKAGRTGKADDDVNVITFRLGDGWYRGCVAAYSAEYVFGLRTALLAQIEVTYKDGSRDVIGTDESFQWSNDGPVRFADLKDGEIYDAGKAPGYGGKAVLLKEKNPIVPAASDNVPVRRKERFTPKLLIAGDGTKVLDFGQNIAGMLKFSIQGAKGQKVRIVCGEVLGKDGKVDLSGIQESKPAKGWSQLSLVKKLLGAQIKGDVVLTPKQEIRFICSGSRDEFQNSFSVFGFRYAQISTEKGLDLSINPADFEAVAVYSDMEQTGSFRCSNQLVNRLYENTVWSMKGNFLDIPTDCPTRERLGWTGDAQIFFDTGAYMMDTAAFFRKWFRDMQDDQYDNGLLSAVVPYQGVEMMYKATGSSVGWADAVYLIPYRYYKRYGDRKLLKSCWPMIRKYADYLTKNLGMKDKKEAKQNPYNDYTYEKGVHLGEWLEPEEFRDKVYAAQAKHPEECTAYLYFAMKTIGEIAELLGEKEYVSLCARYADGAKKAYDALFVKTGTLNTNSQANLVRPLALGLLDGEEKKKAQNLLVKAVEDYNYRVGTGFLSTPFILPALTEAEETETAYRMLENTEKPGWLAEVKEGATTVWENWEGNLSQNHYSPGAVCQWLFDTVGGIRPAGERHFIIEPVPGGSLTFADVSYLSIYGKVSCRWERTEEGIWYHIEVPSNVTAEIRFPDGQTVEAETGVYELTERKDKSNDLYKHQTGAGME